MNAFMALQCECVPETLPTLCAFVRLFNTVYYLMSLQVVFSFESLPTGGADERPRVCVYKLMSLKVHFGFESLLTERALESCIFPFLMAQQVVLKCFCIPKFSLALVAGKRSLFFMSVHVLHQMKLPVKDLVTDVTYKDLSFLLDFSFLCVLAVSVFGLCVVSRGTILCSVQINREKVTTHVQSNRTTKANTGGVKCNRRKYFDT